MLSFAADGAELFAGAAAADLPAIDSALAALTNDQAGVRMVGVQALDGILGAQGSVGAIASELLGSPAFPVRAVLFDKTPDRNWALAWHQDRTIVVRERLDVDGFGPWSTKAGLQHVAPPVGVLIRMATLRVHLDAVSESNAPLLIAPGSHRIGYVNAREVEAKVREMNVVACLAEAGDVWAYSTPILHASKASLEPGRRRVLQVDYAIDHLPGGLEWLGV